MHLFPFVIFFTSDNLARLKVIKRTQLVNKLSPTVQSRILFWRLIGK